MLQLTPLKDYAVGQVLAVADSVCTADPPTNCNKSYALLFPVFSERKHSK